MKIKDMFGLMVTVPLAGHTLESIGSHMTGGIGKATQSFVSLGVLGKSMKLFK